MDPRIGCCIDVGHTVRTGTDVVQAIHEAGPRLFNVHMKDLTNFESKESQVAVGDGIMPVRKMFGALIATRYKGFVDLEYEIHPDDPMPGVISSLIRHFMVATTSRRSILACSLPVHYTGWLGRLGQRRNGAISGEAQP